MTTSGHRSPPFARRMKLPTKLMIALHVSTAPLYVSHGMDWKESSRAPSLASSSARSLPAAVKRPVSSSLARSALDRCALHFVTESTWASSPMSRKQSQIRLHMSACGLRAAVHHFGARSKPLSTVAQSDTNAAPGSDRMMACHSAHNSARKIRRCTGREIGMAPRAEQTNSREVSWICATAHPACPPWDPCLHIKEPSTNSLPLKLLPTTLGCIHIPLRQ